MKTRNKVMLMVVAIILLAAGGGVYYLISNIDALVKAAIEKYGSATTQTAVRVQRVQIKLAEGSGSISGLTVANPAGFAAPYAFSLSQITMRINVKALTGQQIVIDAIQINAPEVFYELNADKQGNLNVLKDNITGGAQPGAKKSDQPAEGKTVMLTIRKLVMAEAQLHATVVPLNNRKYQLRMPALQMNNLSGTPEQIGRQILDQVIAHATVAVKNSAVGQEVDQLKAETKARAVEMLDIEKEKVTEKLRNLLSK